MALTEIYVDPSINADSGAGTVGDPYGDLEYAIEQETFDTTNGTRVNIKAGTDEILAAALQTAMADTSVSIAWVPVEAAPLVFQGYTSAAGDGGQGGISGGGAVGVLNGAVHDYVSFIDLHLHNCGAATILDMDNYCSVIRCELNNTSGSAARADTAGFINQCYIHDIGSFGANITTGEVSFCFLKNGTNTFNAAILPSGESHILNNIISVSGASDGINGATEGSVISDNSIWSNGGTGQGLIGSTNQVAMAVTNNIIEGFSGAGGKGYDVDPTGQSIRVYGGNAAYNNETNYLAPAGYVLDDFGEANETLVASAFTDAANDNFSPVDTGNIKEGAVPQTFGTGQ